VRAGRLSGLENFSHERTLVLAATSWIGMGILIVGKRRIPALKFVEEKDCHQLPH
jgi:hypothetical protein